MMGDLLQAVLGLVDLRLLFLCLLIFTPLEYLLPAQKTKKIARPGMALDAMHFVFSALFTRLGLVRVIVAAMTVGDWITPEAMRSAASAQPVWLQVLLCTIITDLGFYAAHRLMHQVPWLWNFHAIHHSSEQLDWLAAFRVHPVDQVIVKGTSLLPIFVIGFSMEAIAIATFIYQWQSLLIHSNIRVSFGKLNWVMASPEFHHWHHANQPEAHNKNYSGQLPLWDLVFGTLHLPSRLPETYGIDEALPDTYTDQIIHPFRSAEQRTGNPPNAAGGAVTPR